MGVKRERERRERREEKEKREKREWRVEITTFFVLFMFSSSLNRIGRWPAFHRCYLHSKLLLSSHFLSLSL